MGRRVIGVDVGGTKTKAQLFEDETAIATRTIPTVPGPDGVVTTCTSAIESLLDGTSTGDVVAVGVGLPGEVDPASGTVRHAVNLGFDATPYPISKVLERRIGVPVTVENDVRAATVGVYQWLRADRPVDSAVYLAIGTGISAGFVDRGRLVRGHRGMAGEIGHVIVDERGPRCRCGAQGCLEAVLGGWALGAAWQEGAPPEALFTAADQGDPEAVALADRAGRYLAQAIQWLLAGFDPQQIVIGGGLIQNCPGLLQRAHLHLRRWSGSSQLHHASLDLSRISALPPGLAPGAWGAAFLADRERSADCTTDDTEGEQP